MKKILLLIILIIVFLCTTGCYDYYELNDLDIVNGIFIDYQDNKYQIYLEIVENSEEKITSNFILGKGDNLEEALTEAKNNSDKKVYLKNISTLVLSKEIVNNNILEVLEYIIRDPTINNNYIVLVSDNLESLINLETKNDSISNQIYNTIKSNYSNSTRFIIEKVISTLINKTYDISLPYIYLNNKEIDLNNLCTIKDNKLNTIYESKYYELFFQNTTNYVITTPNINTTIIKNKIKYQVDKKYININISISLKVNNISNYDLNDEKNYQILENEIKTKLENEVNEFIESNPDILGLKYKYYLKNNKQIENPKYKVNVEANLNQNGSIIGDFND